MLENNPLHSNSSTDSSASLTSRLDTSQQHMIRLNASVPRPSGVATQHLDFEFKSAFPSLASTVGVDELAVRVVSEEIAPPSELTTDEPPSHVRTTYTVALDTLFWQAVAGRVDVRALLLDPANFDIVIKKDDAMQFTAALNSRSAKDAFRQLITTLSGSYEQLVKRALDAFWDAPAGFSQSRTVSEWLALEFAEQLRAQADLHRLDGTLSAPLHRAITDHALAAPDAASRVGLAERTRPGVYSMSVIPPGWGFDVPVPGTVALTRHDDSSDYGAAVLYRPGRPLEIHADLTALKASVKEDGHEGCEVNTVSISESFLARLVTDLRSSQQAAFRHALLNGPAETEDVSVWVGRMDSAADLGDKLDLAAAMDERELRLNVNKQNDWLLGNPSVTGSHRVAWWTAVQHLQQTMAVLSPAPDPVTLATPDALRDQTRRLLAGFIKDKYPPVDSDDVFLSIRKQVSDPHAPTGTSPFGSGVSVGAGTSTFTQGHTLTEWAMSNLTEAERNAAHHSVEGPLSFAQMADVIQRADIGARLPAALQLAARERQADWMSLKEKHMRAQAWAAHISGDFSHDRNNTGLKMVLAALHSPTPTGRARVNGHEIVVRQLQWGDSVLKEILAFGVKTLASRPSLTLYTPGAPDGKFFRDVDAQSDRSLKTDLARALTATPEMTHWLIAQLPLLEQANHLASLVSASENLAFIEKIKQVTQSVFARAKDRSQRDFASNIESPVVEGNLLHVLHETQITHAIKTANMLTVSNAERDSTAAREGRSNAVLLLTGAMSLVPASRLGGVLGRAILPTMTGGAAVSAITDEGGSFSQWTSDFISGLGEVVAEGGQDLIMARAARSRGKAGPALSSLPRMPDPDLKPLALKEFEGKGLIPEGSNRYRDVGGQGYLKLAADYYKTALQGGERIIYAPDNRTNQRTVRWENGTWRVNEPQRLLGGGPVLSYFRTPETLQQKKFNALLEGVLVTQRSPSPEVINAAKDIINSMPDELAERVLRETMDALDVLDINTYRNRIRALNQGRGDLIQHQTPHNTLIYKFKLWQAIAAGIGEIESNARELSLTDAQKTSIFDTAMPLLKKDFFASEGMLKGAVTLLPDNLTGALFIAITPSTGKKKAAVGRIANDILEMAIAAERKVLAEVQDLFPGQGPDVDTARANYVNSPERHDEYDQKGREYLREEMKRRGKPGLLTEIRSQKFPYVIINKGKLQKKTLLITEEHIKDFSTHLARYNTPETLPLTKVPSKKVTAQAPTVIESSVVPAASAATDIYTTSVSLLAETQMAYDNFPDKARAKITDIMEDIRAGRVTPKKFNNYYWYDMAQLDPGSGRGAWRAAFERKGDTWVLQGFYDYHATKAATVWGD